MLKLDSRTTTTFINAAVETFYPELVKWLENVHIGNTVGQVLLSMGARKSSEIICTKICTTIHRNPYKRDLARMIGQEFEDVFNQQTLDDKWWNRRWKAIYTRSGKAKARTILRREGDMTRFPLKGMLKLGAYSIKLYMDWVGGIAAESKPRMGLHRAAVQLLATEEMIDWLRKNRPGDSEGWRPLTEAPVWDGPYRENRKFVHHKGEYGKERTCLEHCQEGVIERGLHRALRAANALQRVAWRRNVNIYEVIQAAWASRSGLSTVPAAEPPEMPPYTTNRAYAAHKEILYGWRMRRRAVANMLYSAEVMHRGANYWQWGADFRGRLYPLSGALSPQGSDLGRALLEFDEGKRLGAEGHVTLGEHGANMWGSRGTMEEVADWLADNESMIEESALDPFACQWWTKAKKPWRFLAFCFEWIGWMEHGADHVCRIPCQVDASSNCYQIVAILLGDYKLARLVNLTDTPGIHDLYDQVAKEAMEVIKKERPPWLAEWKKHYPVIPRKVAKLALIRYCLGGRSFSMANAVQDWIVNRWKYEWPYGEVKAGTMSFVFANALRTVMRGICPLDDFHKWVRGLVNKDGIIQWTSPSGFPVVCEYLEYERILTGVTKGASFSCFGDPTGRDHKGVRRGMIANYVHSIDGGIMHLILNQLEDEGIEVSAIHDCIGGHACDMGRVHTVAREVYARVFSKDLLGQLAQDVGGKPYTGHRPGDYNSMETCDADYMWR